MIKKDIYIMLNHNTEQLLVGCFGFSGPLRQYFSLYRAVSQREGERGEKRYRRVKTSKQPPIRTYYKRNVGRPVTDSLPRTIVLPDHPSETATGRITWNKIYDFYDNAWNDMCLWPFKITTNTILQWFQTRINHNILATNNFLHRIKYIKDPMRSFCAKEQENIRHLRNVNIQRNC